jgi:hypothetical protein
MKFLLILQRSLSSNFTYNPTRELMSQLSDETAHRASNSRPHGLHPIPHRTVDLYAQPSFCRTPTQNFRVLVTTEPSLTRSTSKALQETRRLFLWQESKEGAKPDPLYSTDPGLLRVHWKSEGLQA